MALAPGRLSTSRTVVVDVAPVDPATSTTPPDHLAVITNSAAAWHRRDLCPIAAHAPAARESGTQGGRPRAQALPSTRADRLHPEDLLDPELTDPTSLFSMADRVLLEITEHASLEGVRTLFAKNRD
jgi:hypothetical protein